MLCYKTGQENDREAVARRWLTVTPPLSPLLSASSR